MTTRVAIMGFGRMGRNVFRAIYSRSDMEVVAINDIADPKAMEYLLRFDTLRGEFPEPIRIVDGYLYAKGKRIPVLAAKGPGDVPWFDLGVDVVIEATGKYRSRAELQKHVDAGADRVIMTTPPIDEIDCIYVPGVVEGPLDRAHRLISCGSSTSNCVLAMLKILDDTFPIESAFFTSVHAYTSEQSLIDTLHGDLRMSRAAVENIVPEATMTVKVLDRVLPHLRGKVGGGKLNVPVSDVSCADLVTVHNQEISVAEVNELFRSAAASTMRGIMQYTESPIVSSDVSGSAASCVYDSMATMVVQENMVKTIGWYEQGGGLSHRIVETISQLAPQVVTGVK